MIFAGYWGKSYYINMHSYNKEYALSIQEIYWISFSVAVLYSWRMYKYYTAS